MTTSNHTRSTRLAKTKIHQRQLKVREAFHPYQLNQNPNQRSKIGEIHLKGHWLIEAGFDIDTSVNVRVMEGCLVLTSAAQIEATPTGFAQLNQREQRVITEVIEEFLVKYKKQAAN